MADSDFKEIADAAPAILWVTDPDGLCTYLSRQWQEYTGQSLEEGLGMGWIEVVHPDDRDPAGAIFLDANSRRVPFRLDYRLCRADGVYRWAVDAGCPRFSVHGEYLGQVGSVLDITERKEAEDALRLSEARYRRLVETTLEGVWITDASNRTTYVNERMAEILGYTPDEMLGRSPVEFAADDEARQETIRALRGWRDGGAAIRESRLRHRDGTEISALINANPLRGADGAYEGTLAMVTDFTAHRELERQLLQSQKMEAIGRLAGGVAHDFNNLLTAIGGNTRLVIDQLDAGDSMRADLLEVEQAVARASVLTRQLLTFSRPEASRPAVLDLNALITDFERMLRRTMGTDVIIDVQLDEALPHVRADAVQIEQVLLNLANNARDAMPDGGTLSIRTRRKPRWETTANAPGGGDEDLARITVADTGIGMDEGTRQRVFDPFFTTKPRGQGTGLGMATVHGIITAAGGSIEVASRPGFGSCFTILLPASYEPLQRPDEPSTQPLPRGSERVLVVEDDPAVRALAVRILTRQGYEVVETDAADTAYRLLQDGNRFDLVLTDMVMPGMSGRDLAQALAAMPDPARVLFMSGYLPEASLHVAAAAANVPFLEKPFTADQLACAVRAAIDDAHPGHGAAMAR